MKRKPFLLLVVLGIIWQVGFEQERDSVGLQILQDSVLLFQDSIPIQDSIIFDQDSTLFIQDSVLFMQDSLNIQSGIKSEIDSLVIIRDSILIILSAVENQIDSLQQLIYVDSSSVVEKPMLIEGFDWEFTVKSVTTHQNQVIVVSNIKNLQGSEIRLYLRVEIYEKEITKKNEKGAIPLVHNQKIQSRSEDITLKISIDKERWQISNFALKCNIRLTIKNGDTYEQPFNKVEWEKMRKQTMTLL